MTTIPNLPVAVQCNFTQTTAWSPWTQTYANILCYRDGAPTLRDLVVRRGVFYPTISADTAIIQAYDPTWDIVPERTDGALYPSPLNGCGVRILRQTALGSDTWLPVFFGYISRVEPTYVDSPRSLSLAVITVESPLRYLSTRNVQPAALPAGAPVYSPSEDSALKFLLQAAGLWTPGILDLEDPGEPARLLEDWGGKPVQFGQALTDLAYLALAAVQCVPLYATASAQPDWQLRWWTPRFDDPTLSLVAAAGDLSTTPSVSWAGEPP